MQEDRRVGSVWLGVLALAAGCLAGCGGDNRSELAKATDKARRLYDRACGNLRDTPYKVRDKYAPLIERDDTNDANAIGLLPPGALNPQAEQGIQEAIDSLSKAVGSASGSRPMDLIRARAVLARLHRLEGYRLSLLAAQKRSQAWELLLRTENAAIRMGDHGKRIANCDALLGVTDESLPAMVEKAKADAEASQTTIGELKGQVQKLGQERAALTAANEKLLGEARKLRVDSQLADVMKGIELFDAALVKEDQVTANASRITEIEDAVQSLNGKAAMAEADLAAARSRTAAAEKIAADRQQRQAEVRQQRDGFVQLLTETQKEVETLAGQVMDACKGASDLERKALAAYAQADEQYGKYIKAAESHEGGKDPYLKLDPVILSLSADVRMARGSLRAEELALQQRIDHTVGDVTKLWSALPVQKDVPASIAQVAGYLADPAKAKEDAQNDFRWAAKDYERALATRRIARKQEWVYQLQIAAAYASLCGIAPDADAQRKGTDALNALGKEEGSPLVAPEATQLRRLLAAATGSGGTSAPATP